MLVIEPQVPSALDRLCLVLQDGQSSSAKTKLNNMAGNAEKLAGNASFKAGQWVEAIGHYSRAITKVRAVSALSEQRWTCVDRILGTRPTT
jgi:hypothetical protein